MAETKTQRKARAARTEATRKRSTAGSRKRQSETAKTAADRTTELSEDVLKSVESGQRAAIEAVRKFVDTVDQALPAIGEGASRRQKVVDSAMEMADQLVHTQYDFIRKVVDSAGKSLSEVKGREVGRPALVTAADSVERQQTASNW